MPSSQRRQSPHSCPLCCLSCRTPSTASLGGCWPLGIPISSFPEASRSQPEPRSGSNPWSGAAAGAGSRCQTKGWGQRPGCLVPQGRGAGACRARVLSHPGAAAAPTARACHAPASTQPPPWLARLGHSWVPGGPTLALVLCHPCHGHCACTALVRGSAVAPLQLCPSRGAAGLKWGAGEHRAMGAESMDRATAEGGKYHTCRSSPTVPQFPQLLLGAL